MYNSRISGRTEHHVCMAHLPRATPGGNPLNIGDGCSWNCVPVYQANTSALFQRGLSLLSRRWRVRSVGAFLVLLSQLSMGKPWSTDNNIIWAHAPTTIAG